MERAVSPSQMSTCFFVSLLLQSDEIGLPALPLPLKLTLQSFSYIPRKCEVMP